ncbi:MAG: CDP-alcohol phosphatidyltransferase family protein [Aquificae bacterium]|nr:CDP-alcohol phosphatidyltransferase family protein [Aquificota bacterium]
MGRRLKEVIPNLLSGFRLAFSPIGAFCLYSGSWSCALVVLALAAVSDFLDGFLARRWGVESQLGVILDPAADKVALFSYLLALWAGPFDFKPSEVLVLSFLFKEAAVLFGIPFGARLGFVPRPSFWGKAATYALFTYFLVFVLSLRWSVFGVFLPWLEGISVFLLLLAGLGYWRRSLGLFLKYLKNHGREN